MTTLAQPSAPQTRMLLASEGSTTTLLEALLGEPLRLRLDNVRSAPGSEVSPAVREALAIDSRTAVLIRHSSLVTVAGIEVSRNHVVARGPFSDVVGDVLCGPEPIGWTMNGSRDGHSRMVLETGWSSWDADGDRRTCAYKAYVIAQDGRPRIHIRERFNPLLVPTGRYCRFGARAGAQR